MIYLCLLVQTKPVFNCVIHIFIFHVAKYTEPHKMWRGKHIRIGKQDYTIYISVVCLPIRPKSLIFNKLGLHSLGEARTRGSAWAQS